jgi:hypothetical protein
MERSQLREHVAAQVPCESGSDFAGEAKRVAFVESDEKCIDPLWPRSIAADDELRLLVQLQLDPRADRLYRQASDYTIGRRRHGDARLDSDA